MTNLVAFSRRRLYALVAAIILAPTIWAHADSTKKSESAKDRYILDRVIVAAQELAETRRALEQNAEDRTSATIRVGVSLGAAIVLGLVTKANIKGARESEGLGSLVFASYASAAGIVAMVPVAYGAYKGYDLYVLSSQRENLIQALAKKEDELEAARKVLEELGD